MSENQAANNTSTSESFTVGDMLSAHGLTEVSEQELMGSEPTEPEKPATQEPSSEEKKPEDTKEEETKSEDAEAESKPPKGFVPLEALKEVRGENKYLKQQLANLQDQVTQLATAKQTPAEKPVENPFSDFAVLTDAEYTALAEESPSEALVYMNKLLAYKDFTRSEAEQARAKEEAQTYLADIFERTNRAMEEAVPGLFDEDTGAMFELREFAEKVGFTEDMFYLTNPATKIILPGESEPLVLGEQAASVIRMLANFRKSLGAAKSSTVDEAALRASITAEVEQELLTKIKAGGQFKSINALPPSKDTRPVTTDRVLNEVEFAKLSPTEQEAYLSGQ